MADFEQTQTVDASAEDVFTYLADVRNLPRYFPHMTDARPTGGEDVEVAARVDGDEHRSHAWFRADEQAQRIMWGSENDDGYEGWLTIEGDGALPPTRLVLHLHTPDAMPADRIDEDLRRSLETIKATAESGGSALR